MNFESLLYNIVRPVFPIWFAKRYTDQFVTRILKSKAVLMSVVSKAAIHSNGPYRTGYGAFINTIKAANRRLGLVKCRDDFGAAYEAKLAWPDVYTIGALTNLDDARYDAAKIFAAISAKARLNPWIDAWEVFNERDGEYAQQANCLIELMPMFESAGLGLVMFNCASGTPPTDQEDGGSAYAEIARACLWAKSHGYNNVRLGLHEYYSGAPGTIGRFVTLANYLQSHGALIPIALTEWGFETYPGDGKLMDFIRESDPIYMTCDIIGGCACFTLGNAGWAGSNYYKSLPHMAQYIATVPEIAPPPPPVKIYVNFVGKIVDENSGDLSRWIATHDGEITFQ